MMTKLANLKSLMAIQQYMKKRMTLNDTWNALDSGVGFLTVQSFQKGLPTHFELTLRQNEIANLFLQIDTDNNGIIYFHELEVFFQTDFQKKVGELENEK
jgi:Ca2+-binding EF-hand superfamily protein